MTNHSILRAICIVGSLICFAGAALADETPAPSAPPPAAEQAPEGPAKRTTRCDGKGELKTPTSKPCKSAAERAAKRAARKAAKGKGKAAKRAAKQASAHDAMIVRGMAQLVSL